MKGVMGLIRSDKIKGYRNLDNIYEWSEGRAYLIIDRVSFNGVTGAVLCYTNPPVHQVGNPGLDAYLEGLGRVLEQKAGLGFLLLSGANDPVHAGGDLKESLARLDETSVLRQEKEEAGASHEEIDRLYGWADMRLEKGIALHGKVRRIAGDLRVVAVCGGGTRFGGSAEIPLMADYLVGDSRSGMCFSEAMIGLIPGWGGIGRALVKAGRENAEYMAKTSREVKAEDLRKIGVYNRVVPVDLPFPSRHKSGDPESDRNTYVEALADHDEKTGLILLPVGLETAVCPEKAIPVMAEDETVRLAEPEEVSKEVNRRAVPGNYSDIAGRPLREVKEEVNRLGRPLAPQSIEALERLFEGYDPEGFDEHRFVEQEKMADSALYRDPRLRAGLEATLEQLVADYSDSL